MPKVSVIVPNYNHAQFLRQRIDSILAQTFQDYELILLDDSSKDASRDIIHQYQNKFPHIRVFINEKNSGSPFKQWDLGVKQSKGGYIWIAESDDYADNDFLSEMVPLLDKNDNAGLAYCDAMIIDDRDKPIASISDRFFPDDHRRKNDYINGGKDEIADYLSIKNTINNTSGVLFRKCSYIDAGFADHAMRYCGDWFLYLRILLLSDVAYSSKRLNYFRHHEGSSFHRYYMNSSYLEEVIRIYDFIKQNVSISPEIKRKIHDQLSTHFCLSIRGRSIPSKKAWRGIKKSIPFFEFYLLVFLTNYLLKHLRRK
jgi:glycosyltransferase involved in cell wall biosynthesis